MQRSRVQFPHNRTNIVAHSNLYLFQKILYPLLTSTGPGPCIVNRYICKANIHTIKVKKNLKDICLNKEHKREKQ